MPKILDSVCSSSWSFLLIASSSVWNRFADKLSSSISCLHRREEATFQIEFNVFLSVGRNVGHLTAHSVVALANQTRAW